MSEKQHVIQTTKYVFDVVNPLQMQGIFLIKETIYIFFNKEKRSHAGPDIHCDAALSILPSAVIVFGIM